MKPLARFILLITLTTAATGCLNINLDGSNRESSTLSEQAKSGDVDAQYALGLRYTNGVGVNQNFALGIKSFSKAAERNHTRAQYMLGMGYYTGRGIAKNDDLAKSWLQKAAEKGHAAAQYQLGEMFLNGYGGYTELTWAVHWLRRSAQQGNSRAQFSLAIARLKGLGSPTNLQQGLIWLQRSKQLNYAPAKEVVKELSKQYPKEMHRAERLGQNWKALPDDRMAAHYQLAYIQQRLNQEGYDAGSADGLLGPRTTAAIRAFTQKNGINEMPAGGNALLIDKLRQLEQARESTKS